MEGLTGRAADAIVGIHLVFIAFVLVGAVLVVRWHRLAWLHVPAFLWGAAVQFFGGECPLTPLEQSLRTAAGETSYTGGFIEHYIAPILFPDGISPSTQLWLGVLVVAINVAVYTYIILRRRRSGR